MRDRARNEAHVDPQATETHATAESATSERYVDGAAPPVHAGFADPGRSASQLAFEEDDNVRELKSKVGALVTKKFGGDYHKAFEHYANKDGGVGKAELANLLSEAGVGNGMTRGTWAKKIIEKLDKNGDASIEWDEFQSVFAAAA